jgi:septal ring factor EnvC (AmiA/AmiB activator)
MDQTVEQLQAEADAAQRRLEAAKTADAALQKAKETPRAPDVVLADLLEAFAMRLGNRPELKLLITEYKASTKQLG